MPEQEDRPRVGLGVIVVNRDGKVPEWQKKRRPAPHYSIPGGHLNLGETFEAGAIREVKEETDIDIKNPEVIAVTNNLETYQSEGLHYISVILLGSGIFR